MFGLILAVAGALIVGIAVVGAIFVLGMRTKSPIVQGAVIWLATHVFNGRQMRTAGTPGAYAGIIRHRGRVSGQAYETPVGVTAFEDGFIISLPYGRSNWARNVLAAGSATLVHEGQTFEVDAPEIIPVSMVERAFSAGDQRMHRIFGVTDVLRLRRVETTELAEDNDAATAAVAA